MVRRILLPCAALLLAAAVALLSADLRNDRRLKHSSREADRGGWITVRLAGSPADIGFQHGYLLAPEIQDNLHAVSFEMQHDENKDWAFFRKVAQTVFWPHIEDQYREELNGIAEGAKAHGDKLDLWDIVALNAWLELPYYDKWYDKGHPHKSVPERCSAFVATGSYTLDGRPVIAHNNWTTYLTGERWNIIFDITPDSGNHIIMDGMPGLIHSGDDFGINSGGIMITETTISEFNSFTPDGIPEFVRARKAMQYASSIDEFARIMRDGNTGGYANNWLVADRRTGEIASLELGLKNTPLLRTKDGYFVGSNFPADAKLMKEETDFNPDDRGKSENARHERWLQLMQENKGRINIAAAERFLADHYDVVEGKEDPSERTLCGHIELSPRGMPTWQKPYAPCGAVQNKVTDAASAESMTINAFLGHACGRSFKSIEHLGAHPEYAWQASVLKDMDPGGWTSFTAR